MRYNSKFFSISLLLLAMSALTSCGEQKANDKIFKAEFDKNTSYEKIVKKIHEVNQSTNFTLYHYNPIIEEQEDLPYSIPVEQKVDGNKFMFKIRYNDFYSYSYGEYYQEDGSYYQKSLSVSEPFDNTVPKEYHSQVSELGKEAYLEGISRNCTPWFKIDENGFDYSNGVLSDKQETGITVGLKKGKLALETSTHQCVYFDYINKTKILFPKQYNENVSYYPLTMRL